MVGFWLEVECEDGWVTPGVAVSSGVTPPPAAWPPAPEAISSPLPPGLPESPGFIMLGRLAEPAGLPGSVEPPLPAGFPEPTGLPEPALAGCSELAGLSGATESAEFRALAEPASVTVGSGLPA